MRGSWTTFGEEHGKAALILYALVAAVVAVVLYAHSFHNQFIWDAQYVFLSDPTTRDIRSLPEYFLHDFWSFVPEEGASDAHLKYYRPLIKVLHLAEYHVFGTNPVGYNTVSILLHAGVVVLAFLLVLSLTGQAMTGFLAALLFAVNPVHVEAVSWAYSDSYLAGAFLSLLSFLLYHRRRFLAAYSVFFASLFCRESAVLLPVVIVAYELLLVREKGAGKWRRIAPLAVLSVLFLAIRRAVVGPLPVSAVDAATRLNTMAVVIKRYVKIFFVPDGMITVYRAELFPHMTTEVALSYGVVALLIALGAFLWYRKREYLFWYLWFFIWMSVSFNVGSFGEYLMADKLLYPASLGLCTLIALAASGSGRYRKQAIGAVLVLALVHGGITVARTRYWTDEGAYFSKAYEFSPRFPLITYRLGGLAASAGRYDEAIAWYRRTIEIDPRSSISYSNLGTCYYLKGEDAPALQAWQQAIAADPANPMPYYNIGLLLEKKGKPAEALARYRRFVSLVKSPSPDVLLHIRKLELALSSGS